MKKFLSLLLTLALMLSIVVVPASAATVMTGTNGNTIYVSTKAVTSNEGEPTTTEITSVAEGGDFFIQVNFSGNPTVLADSAQSYAIILQYDNTKMAARDIVNGLTSPTANCSFTANSVLATWASEKGIKKGVNIQENGTLYNIYFTATTALTSEDLAAFVFVGESNSKHSFIADQAEAEFTLVQAPALSVADVTSGIYTSADAATVKAALTSATYIDATGASSDVKESSDLTIALPQGGKLTAGDNTCTATYNGVSTAFKVTATAVAVSGLEVTTQPTTLSYTSGDQLDLSGLVVKATFNDGTVDSAFTGYTASPAVNTALTVTDNNGKPVTLTANGTNITADTSNLTVARKSVTVPTADGTYTYNTQEQEFTVGNNSDKDFYEITGNTKGTNAGEYTASATLKDTAESQWASEFGGKLTWTIAPKTVASPTVTVDPSSYEFTGSAITPTSVVVKDGDTVIDANEYTLSYSNNTNYGEATVTVTDKEGGNYTVNGTGTFSITKSAPMVTAPTAKTLTYTGTEQDLVTAGSATGGTIKYSTTQDGTYSETVPTGINAGDYTVWYKVVGDDNHSDTTPAQVANVKIAPKSVEAQWGSTTLTYSGSAQKPTCAATGVNGEEINVSVSGEQTNVGANYTATASIESVTGGQASADNYTLTNTEETFAIGAKSVTPTVTISGTYTYSGSAIVPEAENVTVKDGETVLENGTDYTFACSDNINAGTATLTVTLEGNYSGTKTESYTIGKKTINAPTADSTVFKYTGSEQTYNPDGFYGTTMTISNNKQTEVGTYTVTVALKDKNNTQWAADDTTDKTFEFKLNKHDTVSGVKADFNIYYGNTEQQTVALTNFNLPEDIKNAAFKGDAAAATDNNSILQSHSNTAFQLNSGVAKGKTASWTVTISSDNYEDITATVTVNTVDIIFKVGDDAAAVSNAVTVSDSKTYGVTWGDLVKVKGDITATVDGKPVTGTYTLNKTGTDIPTVGDKTYNVLFTSTDGKYQNVKVFAADATVTIAPKAITATVVAASKIYGSENPSFDFTVPSGALVGSDTKEGLGLTLTCAATTTSGVGSYDVTKAACTSENYNVTVSGTKAFTITPKAITVAAENKSKTYGEDLPAFTFTDPTGLVGSDTKEGLGLTLKTDATKTSNVGAYDIVKNAQTNNNYNITVTSATLTINRKAVTISGITAENRAYNGERDVTLVYTGVTFDGKLDSDTLTVTATGTMADADVGEGKDVKITGLTLGGASAGNYVLADEGQQAQTTVTITKKPAEALSLTAKNAVYTGTAYDAETDVTPSRDKSSVELTYYADNNGVKGTKLDSAPVNAGTYWVSGTIAETKNIAAAEAAAVKFSITKAPLTITAKDHTITYGDAPADNGVEYSGFVGSDTSAVVSGLAYTISYEQFGNFGEYTITPKDATAANYSITFVPGKLTVGEKEVGLTWSDGERFYYDGTAKSVTATVTGTVNGDELSVTVVGGAQTKIGNYVAEATGLTGAKAANYKLPAAATKSYSIVAALESVTVTPTTVTATVDNSTLTVKLSGYVDSGVTPTIDGYTITGDKITANGVTYTVDTGAVVVKPANVEIAEETTTVGTNVATTDHNGEALKDDELAAVNTVKDSTNNKIENVTEAAAQTIVEEAKKADETLTDAQKQELGDDYKIEAQVVVKITPTAIDFTTDTGKKTMNLDVSPEIKLMAKSADSTKTVNLNTVPLEKLATWTLVQVEIPAGFTPTVAKHHLKSGGIEWLKVEVVEGSPRLAKWYQSSFSGVELVADTRTATVTFNYFAGGSQSIGFTPADIGTAFPTDSQSGKTFKGWDFYVDGGTTAVAGGPYKTLDDTLLTTLAGKAVTAEPKFSGSSGNNIGGGTVAATNAVSVAKTENGAVSADVAKAKAGDTVTVTVKPNDGYKLDKLTVTDKNGKTVTLKKVSDTKYTFTMPDGKVSIAATFVEGKTETAMSFTDVAANDWYYDAVQYAYANNLMNGTGDGQFSPDATTTRGMIFTILARNAGVDTTGGATWYEAGMNWAKEQGISDGTMPEGNITREQLATMLYRVVKNEGKGFTGSWMFLLDYPDAASVSDWANEAMHWCVMKGIINGKDGKLVPTGNASRAEVATMLMRFLELDK